MTRIVIAALSLLICASAVAGWLTVYLILGALDSGEQQLRERQRALHTTQEAILREVRQPNDIEGAPSRADTYVRIEQLCEATAGCDP